MSVLILADQSEGHIKKSSYEALSYGAKLAEMMGISAEGLVLGTVKDDLSALGKYGVKKIHQVADPSLDHLDAQQYAAVMAEAVKLSNATVVVFSNNLTGKAVAPRLSARLKAGLVAGAVALPDLSNGFVVKKNVFSGKAFANIAVKTDIKIISLNPNSYTVVTGEGSAEVSSLAVSAGTPRDRKSVV